MGFTYLITGSSRSLGLAYSRALLRARPGARIIASARDPSASSGLQQLVKEYGTKKVHLCRMDVADKTGAANAAEELAASGFLENGIDALIHNAGVALDGTTTKPSQLTPQHVLDHLNTNLFGVLNVNSAFLPMLRQGNGKQIFALSSICASIEEWGGKTSTPAYSLSKVALNMYLKKLSVELQPEGFTIVMLHPGYVKTDMNKGFGQLTAEEAARIATEKVFLAVSPSDNGKFVQWEGKPMPW